MSFKKTLKKRINNEKGLTLVELLAVIVILGIISAIAIPSIGNIIENSRAKAVIADAQQVLNTANVYFVDNPTAETFTEADKEYLDGIGKLSKFTVTKATKTITFTAVVGSSTIEFGPYTLDQLTKLKVKGGEILESDETKAGS